MTRDYGVDTIVLRLEWPAAAPAAYAGRMARMRPLGAGVGVGVGVRRDAAAAPALAEGALHDRGEQ